MRHGVWLAAGWLAALTLGSVLHASAPVARTIFPGVTEVEFASAVLGESRRFCVVTPEHGGPNPAPVLFFLHGRGRNPRSLVDIAAMREAFRAAPFVTVFPQGDDGWYVDQPVEHGPRYEAYLQEVLAVAARLRPISREARRRAIGGWSMGGYGAMRFAARHPEEFGVVVSVIGLLDFPRIADLPEGQNYPVPVARFGTDPEVWTRYNPLQAVAALRGRAVMLITGTTAFDRTMNEHFHDRLMAEEVPHAFVLLPGGHTFDLVQAAVPHVIAFVARELNHGSP